MNKYYFFYMICAIVVCGAFTVSSVSGTEITIPPTPAFSRIITPTENLTATVYNDQVKLTGVNGIIINGIKNNNTLQIDTNALVIPRVVADIKEVNQTSSLGMLDLYTVPSDGDYQISVYDTLDKSAIGGYLNNTVIWTDETGITHGQGVATHTLFNTTDNYNDGTVFFHVKGTTTISFQSSMVGVLGSPEYDIYIVIEKLP